MLGTFVKEIFFDLLGNGARAFPSVRTQSFAGKPVSFGGIRIGLGSTGLGNGTSSNSGGQRAPGSRAESCPAPVRLAGSSC